MPELPEVETMVRGLRPALEGRQLRFLAVHDPFLLQGCTAAELEQVASGARVRTVERRGKWVVLALGDRRGMIVIQPRMTGGFRLVEPDRPEHVRLTFQVDRPAQTVWFCDTRRLGKVAWYDGPDAASAAFSRSHGPDALEIASDDLASRLKRTARAIKPTLMDQKVLAGVGNIYADEILFRARLHPERPARSLKASEVEGLHAAIGAVLSEAIAAEGSTFDGGYRTVLGLDGGFLAQNAMYGRAGEACPGCQRPVVKTKIVGLLGRPTYLCPTCQPLRRGGHRRSARS
ncbi:MAG TPA: bifunctional DNA-formamidopyrimidine glycosylase/DNA-(apurinic or apyrimidinic site) lyase [Isosphaeraceae bacterium]|jgi:formamidopyrimidine-DNA glycosylase|nr:bifunctional DNA-formamidopyrimidine glycosylase/DNA-(apurinic or apyrimidinic site) lyase [Isosphaeraceae bacterium]